MNLKEKLNKIIVELKAPKNQRNNFGKYNYRSCEDILEALKPLFEKYKCFTIIEDDILQAGDRFYVKAKIVLYDAESEETLETVALAREPQDKKGCDSSQITGASSSYARKYALNGMFCIDDNKDADSMDNRNKAPQRVSKAPEKSIQPNQLQRINILISELGIDAKIVEQKEKIYKWLGITSLKSITESQANTIISKLIAAKKIKKENK